LGLDAAGREDARDVCQPPVENPSHQNDASFQTSDIRTSQPPNKTAARTAAPARATTAMPSP
ncbi:MAG: hypothetical protein M3134_02230, partial [Actinomycetota bacterium]|nr:hypothetical protein [Actinomycetota bacterium]